jgi:predicted O-methyltransferase YrrM
VANNAALAQKAIELGAVQKRNELTRLLDFLAAYDPPKVVVEIGTARGGTFFLWCRIAAHNATLISIDKPGGDYGAGYTEEETEQFASYATNGQSTEFLMLDSHHDSTRNKLSSLLRNQRIDLLFLDGDHTYDGVRTDYNMYEPFVEPGGLIVFHDIVQHSPLAEENVEVYKFWSNLRLLHGRVHRYPTDPLHC